MTANSGMEERIIPASMSMQLGEARLVVVINAVGLVTSPGSARHLRAKGKGRRRRVEKVVWTSSSRAEASLLKEVGVWESLDSG